MSSEHEACIIVYDDCRKMFILATIKPKSLPDAAPTNNNTKQDELRQAMIARFGNEGFN